jgi:hypothetical protein
MNKNLSKLTTNLPILKDVSFDAPAVNITQSWRKGEKPAFNVVKFLVIGAIAYGAYFVIPMIFSTLVTLMATVLVGVGLIVLWMLLPVFFRMLRMGIRWLHKSLIKWDPVGQLRETYQKRKAQKLEFTKANQSVEAQSILLQKKSYHYEEVAKKEKSNIEDAKRQLAKLKGKEDHDSKMKLQRLNGVVSRATQKFNSANGLIMKYGSKALTMKKVSQRLDFHEINLDNKLEEFRTSIDILEADLEFASTSRHAIESANSVLGLTSDEDLDFAVSLIERKISEDMAVTSKGINTIMSMTTDMDLDSDELFAKLDAFDMTVNSATRYADSTLKLTTEEKIKSGFSLFN